MADHLTLGGLIEQLQDVDPAKEILFDFCFFMPKQFRSYRGFYEDLALGYESYDRGLSISALDLYNRASDMLGKTITGYKGGDYLVDRDTRLWVANWGEATDTAIVDVIESDTNIVLATAFKET
jgi:hypothetical protein